MNIQDRKKQAILELLNLSNIEITEVNIECWRLFKQIDYRALVKPLILRAKKEGVLKEGQMAIKYGLTLRQVKHILYSTKYVPLTDTE